MFTRVLKYVLIAAALAALVWAVTFPSVRYFVDVENRFSIPLTVQVICPRENTIERMSIEPLATGRIRVWAGEDTDVYDRLDFLFLASDPEGRIVSTLVSTGRDLRIEGSVKRITLSPKPTTDRLRESAEDEE